MKTALYQANESAGCPLGCRSGTVDTCSLLALSMARDIDAFWYQTRRFFSDFKNLSGIALGMSADHGPLVILRRKPTDGMVEDPPTWLLEAPPDTPLVSGISGQGASHAVGLLAWMTGRLCGCVILFRCAADGPFDAGENGRLKTYQPAYMAMMNQFIALRRHEIESSFWRNLIESLPGDQPSIATLASHGLSNKEIADRLGRSEASVKFHLHQIYQRFGLHNRAELALRSGEALADPTLPGPIER